MPEARHGVIFDVEIGMVERRLGGPHHAVQPGADRDEPGPAAGGGCGELA